MTGWDEHGHAVKTGLPIDRHLGSGELQDAENCGYAPAALLGELGVDTSHGDPQVQYRDGRLTLLDGTVLERGGTLNCVWAVTRLPFATGGIVEGDMPEIGSGCTRPPKLFTRPSPFPPGTRITAAHMHPVGPTQADVDAAYNRGYTTGQRHATDGEGWSRRWSVRDQHGRVSKSGFTEAGAKARAAETGGTFVSRLVGPWEDVEQGEPVCTCPMIDVTNIRAGEVRTLVPGYDPTCPVCLNPYAAQAGSDHGQV